MRHCRLLVVKMTHSLPLCLNSKITILMWPQNYVAGSLLCDVGQLSVITIVRRRCKTAREDRNKSRASPSAPCFAFVPWLPKWFHILPETQVEIQGEGVGVSKASKHLARPGSPTLPVYTASPVWSSTNNCSTVNSVYVVPSFPSSGLKNTS